mmetsp:Transcript_23621/g.72664  ORF Transcript_23621/g.72664 Transcript_23621/m.72664 type:complete len:109 (-) Transcript_23621:308-634(-)
MSGSHGVAVDSDQLYSPLHAVRQAQSTNVAVLLEDVRRVFAQSEKVVVDTSLRVAAAFVAAALAGAGIRGTSLVSGTALGSAVDTRKNDPSGMQSSCVPGPPPPPASR